MTMKDVLCTVEDEDRQQQMTLSNSYHQNNHHNPHSDNKVSAPHSPALASTAHMIVARIVEIRCQHTSVFSPRSNGASPSPRSKDAPPSPLERKRIAAFARTAKSQSRCVPGGSVGVTSLCCRGPQHMYRSPSPSDSLLWTTSNLRHVSRVSAGGQASLKGSD